MMRLADICTAFLSGGTPSTSNPGYWNGDIAWMTSAHITRKNVTTGQRHITKEGLKDSATNLVPKNNLLVATRVGIGKVAVNKIDVAISQDLTGIIVDKQKATSEFLYWCLIARASQLKSLAQGSTIKGVLREKLEKLQVPLPTSLVEQKTIAEILGTADEAIEKVDGAIEKTQRLKKGLMQELLTKGIGHQEFRETEIGRVPKEWEIVSLGDVCVGFLGGGTPPTSNPNYWDGDIAWMTSAHITAKEVTIGQRYITKEGLSSSATSLVPKDSLLVATRVGVGKAAVNRIEIAISQDLTGVIVDKQRATSEFLYWCLSTMERKLRSLAQGSTIKGVLREELGKLRIALPSAAEQKEISEILTTVDNKLELLRKKKKRLQKIRKGLMGDLLTGRRRVSL